MISQILEDHDAIFILLGLNREDLPRLAAGEELCVNLTPSDSENPLPGKKGMGVFIVFGQDLGEQMARLDAIAAGLKGDANA